jgi:hypothetical protein
VQILPASVSTTTVVRISVTGGGVTSFADLTVNPSGTPPPAATLSAFIVPSSVTGGNAAIGTVKLASVAPSGGLAVTLGSNQPGAASVPATVTVPAGAISANFTITTFPSAGTTVQLSARLGDTILFAALGVTAGSPPPPPPTPAVPSLISPANGATVTLPATLDWSDVSGAASYVIQIDDSTSFAAPTVVEQTVAASQFSATALAAQPHWWRVRAVNAAGASSAWSSARSFAPQGAPPPPPPPGGALTLTVKASGRSGERITSSPAGINVAVGSTGSASFTAGTAITLTVSGGRSAVWSGACSSGGNKTKSCTFTPTASASVTGNVQ